jgi:hypothetical protein
MALYTATHKTSGNDTTDNTVYSTASITPTANTLLIAGFRAGAVPTSITGAGTSWVAINNRMSSTINLAMYAGVATSPSSQALTITYSGTQNECCWSILEVNKTVTTTAEALASIIQNAGNDGSPLTSLTATLTNSFQHPNNITIGIIGTTINGNITVGSGFTELGESDGAGGSIQSQWFQGQDLTVDWTFGSSRAVAFGLEVGDSASANFFRMF